VLNIIHSEGEVSPKIFERTANADSGNEIMMNDKFRQNYTDEVGECLISNEEHLSKLMVLSAQLHHLEKWFSKS